MMPTGRRVRHSGARRLTKENGRINNLTINASSFFETTIVIDWFIDVQSPSVRNKQQSRLAWVFCTLFELWAIR